MLNYGALIVVSITISTVLYLRVNQSLAENEIQELSSQTFHAIQNTVHSILDNANRYSQRIIASEKVQTYLGDDSVGPSNAQSNRDLSIVVNEILLAEETVSSIYIFRDGSLYFSWDNFLLGMGEGSIYSAPWYDEVVSKRGGQVWVRNSGGVLRHGPGTKDYLSLIRVINDLYTFEAIGILMVNIPVGAITRSFEQTAGEDQIQLMVARNGIPLVPFADEEMMDVAEWAELGPSASSTFTRSISGHEYRFVHSEDAEWNFAIALPVQFWSNPYQPINRLLIPLALMNLLLIFFGSIRISRSVTRPLLRLLESMGRAEEGDFSPTQFIGRSQEIVELQRRYNSMITTIRDSMVKEQEEQQIRSRLELDILHEQIKPHFLYNSLESAGYLALTGERENSYRLITSLAGFYRQSLSKGDEVISLAREFEATRLYLAIEKMRYPDTFTDSQDLDETLVNCLIPKLTLQPLVENSLHHGIIPTGQPGNIRVSALPVDGCVQLEVEDDGKGMTPEGVNALSDGAVDDNAGSFGFRGTIRRLELYFGEEFEYSIRSRPGEGTLVSMRFPVQAPSEQDHNSPQE